MVYDKVCRREVSGCTGRQGSDDPRPAAEFSLLGTWRRGVWHVPDAKTAIPHKPEPSRLRRLAGFPATGVLTIMST
jgi:hypothetical protein